MARTGEKWDDELCSEHDGSIASFKNLNLKIDDLSDFKKLFERDSIDIMRASKIAMGSVAGAALIAPFALAAGAFGVASTKVAILASGTWSSTSMAAISGGSMLGGGPSILTAIGPALGAYKGGIVSNSYFGEIEHFEIRKIQPGREGNKHAVIFINGFMSEKNQDVEDWTPHLSNHFAENTWFHVDWESHNLQKLGGLLGIAPETAGLAMMKQVANKAARQGAKRFTPFILVNSLAELIGNPWHRSMIKAGMTGLLLADAISRTPGWTFTLAGHSLGARAIYYALEALGTISEAPRIKNVYLLGGAVGGSDKDNAGWEAAIKAVGGRIFNCYSENDDVLKHMYQLANFGASIPIGLKPIVFKHNKIANLNCSDLAEGHMKWKDAFSSIIERAAGAT